MFSKKRPAKHQNQLLMCASNDSKLMKKISKDGKKKMDKRKKKILESKGYKVGTVQQFLDLTTEESEYIELKLALSEALVKKRRSTKLTQVQLAKILKSSQSRVAKMEKGDPSVSLDLLVKSLLAMGAKKENIAKAIA
jgi:predicted XRE-type DNA-binding protein